MQQEKKNEFAKFLKIFLIVGSVFLIGFSLLSGAEDGGTFHNIPNSLPWLILLILTCLTFKWQILGGILLALFGLATIFFFSAFQFLWILFIISLPIIIIGLLLSIVFK